MENIPPAPTNALFNKALKRVLEHGMLEDILPLILTPAEQESLQQRVTILHLLAQGYTQRQIASQLRVGIATVSRGNHVLKSNPQLFKIFG